MTERGRGLHTAAVLLVSALALACGDDDADGAGPDGGAGVGGGGNGGDSALATPDPDEGETFTQLVEASEGGTVETKSGRAALEIPQGALDADTEITVTVKSKTSKTATSIYDYGPKGTAFGVSADLSIAYDGEPGEGKKAVLARSEADEWVGVPDSKKAGELISGKVAELGEFAVIVVDDDAGDLEGTWKMESASCDGEPQELGGAGFEMLLVMEGSSGTMISTIAEDCEMTITVPFNFPEPGRVDWTIHVDGFSCTGTQCPDPCPPFSPDTPEQMDHSASYTVEGSVLTMTEEEPPPGEYLCQIGTSVTTWVRQEP